MRNHSILLAAVHDYRSCWKDLVLTDIAYKLLAFIIMMPLVGCLFRILVALSGRTVVADEDIVQFLLEPVGWICIVLIGALWIAIIALEQAALMGVVCAANVDRHLGVTQALIFAGANSWQVLRVTTRIIGLAILAAAPFLALAGGTYAVLLNQFDINFYLTQKPLEFRIAVGIAVLLGIGLVAVLLRLATSWFYALPLVIFEGVHPQEALRASRDRVRGHRHKVVTWIIVWLLVTLFLSALATWAVTWLARSGIPYLTGSLGLLLLAVGMTVLAWIGVNLLTNLISTTSFAVVFFRLYANLACHGDLDSSRLEAVKAKAADAAFAVTRRRLAVVLLVTFVLATVVGVLAIRSVRTVDDVEIIAHRGASGAAPENTMASIRQAVEEGADWAEIDVQETADGQVIVFHDSDFKKIANIDLKIWDATLDDLQQIDIGSWFAPQFKDQRVPTLAQVLDYCRDKIRVTIELKYYGHDQALEQRVAEIVEEHGMQSDIAIISLKQAGLSKMKQLRPDWKTGLLTAVAIGDLTTVEADFLAVNANIATRSFIRSSHKRGKQVLVWTVNDPFSMSSMIGRGADGLITDKPGLARQVLQTRGQLSSVERLLIELAGLLGVQREVVAQ